MPRCWSSGRPKVGDAIQDVRGVVDMRNGIENTISGPATVFRVESDDRGTRRIHAGRGFGRCRGGAGRRTGGNSGDCAGHSLHHPRALSRVESHLAGGDEQHAAEQFVGTHRDAGSSLAEIKELPGQTEIRRENLQRDVAVTARLEGRDLGSSITAVQKVVDGLHLPSSIRVVYGGTYAEQQQSFHDLMLVLVLAIVLVFVVLLFEFRTLAAPLAILSSAILSTSGVFLGLLITRTTFNIASFMGLIMVIGIVAKNGILLLDADQKFRGLGYSAEDAMIQAGRRRLRPILMTALAAAAGMLPLALALGAGSQMLQPLAIAVIGGITISMVLSLIITPAVHYYLSHAETKSQ